MDAQTDAMLRWLAFVGLTRGAEEVRRAAPSDRAKLLQSLVHEIAGGVSGFALGLSRRPPIVLAKTSCRVCSGSGWAPETSSSGVSECWNCEGPLPPIPRERIMQDAISSVLVCLQHSTTWAEPGVAADLLLERGHTWLGEPLALWLADEREKAVDLLLERVPVLPEFAEWVAEDERVHLRLDEAP
jgi:hypothetical protein